MHERPVKKPPGNLRLVSRIRPWDTHHETTCLPPVFDTESRTCDHRHARGNSMDRIIMAACAAALALPAAAQAQAQSPAVPLKRIEAPISAGTPVTLRSMVASSSVKAGSVVPFELVSPIVVAGKTIVPAGAQATAVVSTVDRGLPGKPGRVTGRLQTLQYGNTSIRLIGGFEGTGSAGAEPSIPAGLSINGYIDENVPAWTPPPPPPPRPVLPPPTIIADATVTAPPIKAVPVAPSVTAPTVSEKAAVAVRPTGRLVLDLGTAEPVRTAIRIKPKPATRTTTYKSKVTARDVSVESGGTTTRYVY